MTTTLSNIVTVQQTRGDVLPPTDYHSIVSAIKSLIIERGYDMFHASYLELVNHLSDFTNPHHDAANVFHDDVITRVHGLYQLMTPTPLDLVQFKATLVPSLDYLELILRILANQELYKVVRAPTGVVARATPMTYDPISQTNTPSLAIFSQSFATQPSFIQSGWEHPTPDGLVKTATQLTPLSLDLPLLAAPNAPGHYPLNLVTQALTMVLQWSKAPLAKTKLLSLSVIKTMEVFLNPDNSLSVVYNNAQVVVSAPIPQGCVHLQIAPTGHLSIVTPTATQTVMVNRSENLRFLNLDIRVDVNPFPFAGVWGLTSLLLHQGCAYPYPLPDTQVPANQTILGDTDGAVLTDTDGAVVFE